VSGLRCRLARTEEELLALQRLRYRIYVGEQKKDAPGADHPRQLLASQDEETGHHFLLGDRPLEPVGCVTLHLGRHIPREARRWLGIERFLEADGYRGGYVSKLMLDRSMRGHGAAIPLLLAMMAFGHRAGGDYAVFHCNPRLVPLYEHLGFERFGRPFVEPHVGPQVPMVNLFCDAAHFRRAAAALREAVVPYGGAPERIRWLRAALGTTSNTTHGDPDEPSTAHFAGHGHRAGGTATV
jgi:predicted GNAT family N-acyltransferase